MKEGIADGSLATEFPEECAEVFLLLMNVWCDPAVFSGNAEKDVYKRQPASVHRYNRHSGN